MKRGSLAEKIKNLAVKPKHKQKRRLEGVEKMKNLVAKAKQNRSAPHRHRGREKMKNLVLKKYRPKWKPTHIADPPTMPGPISPPRQYELDMRPPGGWGSRQKWQASIAWIPTMIENAMEHSVLDLTEYLEEWKAKVDAATGKGKMCARNSQEQFEYDWYHKGQDFIGCPYGL